MNWSITVVVQMSRWLALVVFMAGCASNFDTGEQRYEVAVQSPRLVGDSHKHKSIFVFLDGTANDSRSKTNVWRLYNLVLGSHDPQMTAIYIEGVGSVDEPVFGASLGHGMEERILRGYKFIAENYSLGDDIYLFGFSRGAHEARSLAGLLSYAGVPLRSNGKAANLTAAGNSIIELVKKRSDENYRNAWSSWSPEHEPLLAQEIREKLKLQVQNVEVTFLGVWDTVPGSSLKDYANCTEEMGFVKKYFYWLMPGVDKGERYKTGSYPTIRAIAHAVSLDEKRSKFAPLLLCPAINPQYTMITEVWFPGAHADVGGGYQDSNELPTISLVWMIGLLNERYSFGIAIPKDTGSANGLAHWSIGDLPANIGSECQDRHPAVNAKIHESFYERKEASPVPIRWKGTVKSLAYPIECSANVGNG